MVKPSSTESGPSPSLKVTTLSFEYPSMIAYGPHIQSSLMSSVVNRYQDYIIPVLWELRSLKRMNAYQLGGLPLIDLSQIIKSVETRF
jgi:hypothetical protein